MTGLSPSELYKVRLGTFDPYLGARLLELYTFKGTLAYAQTDKQTFPTSTGKASTRTSN